MSLSLNKSRKRCGGFTLTELLVSVTIAGLFAIGMLRLASAMSNSDNVLAAEGDTNTGIRRVIQRLEKDVKLRRKDVTSVNPITPCSANGCVGVRIARRYRTPAGADVLYNVSYRTMCEAVTKPTFLSQINYTNVATKPFVPCLAPCPVGSRPILTITTDSAVVPTVQPNRVPQYNGTSGPRGVERLAVALGACFTVNPNNLSASLMASYLSAEGVDRMKHNDAPTAESLRLVSEQMVLPLEGSASDYEILR